jgi:ABC transporter substrate binding protein
MTPDVIVPNTNTVTAVLQHETKAIPIVFVFVGDPVGSGFVASLARPGGNLTGFALFEPEAGAGSEQCQSHCILPFMLNGLKLGQLQIFQSTFF